MTAQSRQPAGVPTGGRFAPHTHAEADVSLAEPDRPSGPADDEGARVPPGAGSYRPYETPSWADRPVHDLMTEMAPDLASQVRTMRLHRYTHPPDSSSKHWNHDLQRLEEAFEMVSQLKDEPFFSRDQEASFDFGMRALRRHGHDGRLAAHLSSTVAPALNRFADHLASMRTRSAEIRAEEGDPVDELLEPSQREAAVRECAEAFAQAGRDYINGVDTPESRERTEKASVWLAQNYLRLWT